MLDSIKEKNKIKTNLSYHIQMLKIQQMWDIIFLIKF